jgi:hypothetical protein
MDKNEIRLVSQKNEQLADYRKQLAEKDAELARLRTRSALLGSLLYEALTHYVDLDACRPTWKAEAEEATKR